MKPTGHVRRVDPMGRMVLPAELRKSLGIGDRDELEIYVEGESIVLVKYGPKCVFCGGHEGLVEFKGRAVCHACAHDSQGKPGLGLVITKLQPNLIRGSR